MPMQAGCIGHVLQSKQSDGHLIILHRQQHQKRVCICALLQHMVVQCCISAMPAAGHGCRGLVLQQPGNAHTKPRRSDSSCAAHCADPLSPAFSSCGASAQDPAFASSPCTKAVRAHGMQQF